MEDIERIINAKNRIFQASISIGKDIPISMSTDSNHVYRVTGSSQIDDIINCGYVRPPLGKAKGGHKNEVFWTQGSDKLFYYDKRPVLETSTDILKEDNQIGAISLNKLTGIWMFDEQQNKYVNNIQKVRNAFSQLHSVHEQINQLKEKNNKISLEYKLMISDGYIDDKELSTLISKLKDLLDNALNIKTMVNDKKQEIMLDSIIEIINEESIKITNTQKTNHSIGK